MSARERGEEEEGGMDWDDIGYGAEFGAKQKQ